MRVLDSDINEHAQRRASLIAAERSFRFDAEAIANATENEKRAVEVVNNLRVHEAKEIWHVTEGTLMHPTMDFLAAKKTMMNTELYQVMKQLPKGGLLRGHTYTMCDVKFIYEVALEYPAIHIRVDSRITPDSPLPIPELKPLPPDLVKECANGPSLTAANYVSGTWVPLGKARSEFAYGGPEAFDKWITGLLALSEDEGITYDTLNRASTVRHKLLISYRLARGVGCYEPISKRFLRRILLTLIEDGICYAEIRGNFSYKMDISEDGSETLSHRDYLVLFGEVVQGIKDQMRSEGREDEFVGAKLIYCVFRTFNKKKLVWYLEDCMTLKAEFPDLIAGFDFLGPERAGNPLAYYLEPLIWFQQESKKRGLDIPFLFLVGEPMGDEGKSEGNLYDALLLGAKRIGHGVNLAKHPLLMQMAKERGVAVEVCPISNELLGLTSPMHHPLTTLLNNGVPVVLCPDNPASYGYTGISSDFFQAMIISKNSNLLSMKQLAKQSLEYSSLSADDKKTALEAWERRWTAFVERILQGDLDSRH
ncbi:hypothetical protein FRC11_008031 [Ceratobasidium sp. 423]|nr:hypothetical protein FRC11_008031 [Ceratobasidium sp. 423]